MQKVIEIDLVKLVVISHKKHACLCSLQTSIIPLENSQISFTLPMLMEASECSNYHHIQRLKMAVLTSGTRLMIYSKRLMLRPPFRLSKGWSEEQLLDTPKGGLNIRTLDVANGREIIQSLQIKFLN